MEREAKSDPLTLEELERNPRRTAETKIEMIRKVSRRAPSKSKRLTVRFLVSPVEITAGKDGAGGKAGQA